MRYLFFICPDPGANPTREEGDPTAWAQDVEARGVHVIGDRLRPSSDATTVRVNGTETLVSDGPYVEAKELIGGFDVIDCKDLDEAIEIASKHPVARFGQIEIRPFWPLDLDLKPGGRA
jgi:hypothetical protein